MNTKTINCSNETELFSSLICSTYNSPDFLILVLDSIKNQNVKNFELIIADDGSNEITKNIIDRFKLEVKFNVLHIWHEDLGWRKSQIHNKAIRASSFDHLIFIDGDCILAPNFIEDHQSIYKNEKENYVFMGRRVELGKKITPTLNVLNYQKKLLSLCSFSLFYSAFTKDSVSILRKWSVKSPLFRKVLKTDNVNDLLGCNFSLSKKSMILINGFNEEVERGEDGDIFVRLRNTNHKLIGKKYFAVMFHLYHSRGNYQYVDDAYAILIQNTNYKRANSGLVMLQCATVS